MKRLLFFVCTLLFVNVLSAQEFWEGDLQYRETEAGEVEVCGCSYSATFVNIPSSVTHAWNNGSVITYSVTSIYNGAFSGCSSLTSVTIPNSVTYIGDYVFSGCSSLTSVTIPNSVTSIGECAFRNCSSLTSVTIPNSVTYIAGSAFSNCSSLTSVTIGNSVTYIEWEAFRNCSSLTSVTIGNSVTYIGYGAFSDCSGLTSVNIPNSVTTIGSSAFEDCSSLASVTIGNSVTSIGERAFANCSSLTSLNFNAINCEDFDHDYYYYDYYYHPFANCPITTINIGNSVQRIPNLFAYELESLTSVTIGNSVTSIGYGAFSDCSGLTSINIPNSVTSIGHFAFYDCTSLTSVTIPNSVISIGNYAFAYCSSLTSVNIPNSVTSIGSGTFSGCSSLTSVTIPNSVTSIGNSAFYNCSGLTSVTIGNSVTSIGEDAFYHCDSLTSVTIPNSVTSIGEYAFYRCRSLTSVVCLANIPPTISSNSFLNTPSNKILYVNCGLINDYISSWGNYFNSNNIQEITFDINTYVNNESGGSVAIERNNCSTATLTATANNCYQFVSWNDGNTENPRVVSLSSDTSFTATFEELPNHNYNVNVSINNDAFGSVSIENDCNSSTLTATANNCYQFVSWNDGNTENPRVVNVSSDTSFTAIFDYILFDTTINATINAGETYAEFGFNESEAGTYVQNLQSINGCDSTITLVLSVNSSLLDIEETEISLYPNPTNSKITFSQAIEKVEVIDLTGKTLLTFSNKKTIDIESLPSGAYYLRLTNEEKTSLQKVIKQ